MGEYLFGVGRGKVPAATRRRVDRIARRHGVVFVAVDIPGNGPSYWFAGPNRGCPFDDCMARAVFDELEAEGVTLPGDGKENT